MTFVISASSLSILNSCLSTTFRCLTQLSRQNASLANRSTVELNSYNLAVFLYRASTNSAAGWKASICP